MLEKISWNEYSVPYTIIILTPEAIASTNTSTPHIHGTPYPSTRYGVLCAVYVNARSQVATFKFHSHTQYGVRSTYEQLPG